ncbi:MAG: hypothetical protein ACTSUE_09660 [Promethearchaeota archaeon]
MRKHGAVSIDEHLFPRTSKKMESSGYFYSTTPDGSMLACPGPLP